ncbi:MAG: hypothetical protein AAF198_12120 [Pseudomonadota bacterium]
MVEHVILHAGMQKTGSTSIQQSLIHFDDGETFYCPFPNPQHAEFLRHAFISEEKLYGEGRERDIYGYSPDTIFALRQFAQSFFLRTLSNKRRKTVIFSSEGLSLRPDDMKARLIQTIKNMGCRVTVILYLREPLGFASSSFQERLKAKSLNSLPDKITPKYRQQLRVFDQLCGDDRFIVREFGREALVRGDVVDDFAKLAGIECKTKFEHNESLTLPAVKLLYWFNINGPNARANRWLFKAKKRMVRFLRSAYRDSPKVPKAWFQQLADFSDSDFVYRRTGIQFKTPRTGEPFDLNRYLQDLKDVDPTPLRHFLDAVEIDCPAKASLTDLLLCVYDYISRVPVSVNFDHMMRQRSIPFTPDLMSNPLEPLRITYRDRMKWFQSAEPEMSLQDRRKASFMRQYTKDPDLYG